MIRTFVTIIIYTALSINTCSAVIFTDTLQTGDELRHKVVIEQAPDSSDVSMHSKMHFWRAAGETVGFNLGLWAFDRYVQKGHFAYISWNTIKDNFRHGFEWDNDHLGTNMFAHPYNGSLFFNAGRSNGFNFWQSGLFAAAGSSIWEMFMECERPSTNDIIATPVGGMAIGEVLYRTSDLVLNDRSTGAQRAGREIAGFLISPMRGINRLITGEAWRVRPTTGREFGIPPITVDVSVGARMISLQEDDEGSRAGAAAAIMVEYGDRYASRTRRPFDYFTFLLEFNAIRTQPLLSRVEIVGRLLSREIAETPKYNVAIGMYQHFDYFDSDSIKVRDWDNKLMPCVVPYKLGTPASAGAGLTARIRPNRIWSADGYIHLNGVFLAGILSDYYRYYNRNYNWASGVSMKLGLFWQLYNGKLSVSLTDQLYKLYTWGNNDFSYDILQTPDGKHANVRGDNSDATFNHFNATVNYRFWKNLYISGSVDYYSRTTNYHDMNISIGGTIVSYPIIHSKQFGTHIMLTCKF